MEHRLTILQTVLPDYRGRFFEHIRDSLGSRFELYGGSYYFESSVKTDNTIIHHSVTNFYLLGGKFLWQRGIKHLVQEEGLLVLEMNPRIISNWYLLLRRKWSKKETVLWGHAWPRNGKESKSDLLRQQMRKLANSIVVYTKQQQQELQFKMPKKLIYAAPNALINKNEMVPVSENPRNLIYVGRLTKAKKVLFLVKAFSAIIEYLPEDTNLLIVGEGEEKDEISGYIKVQRLESRVQLLGHIYDQHMLKGLYASSIMSVSPGYVGLSITQSFGFGVPMLISNGEPHSPEIEAAIEDENSLFYDSDDINSFRESVLSIFSSRDEWIKRRSRISKSCAKHYAVEAMAQVFINLVAKDVR
ncbi:hypothetical protein DCS32_06015 [Dokdonia sp. Dokd-P16]|uniref:glycosyltransferase n=1 Tax=Dokdonia sp. Dokd-P16 TaxID=2173169 RepID=UPI000D545115|nr:glycosyltransferase [Dokdonia sp. Dokd-P16]AWH73728.1 hypothetical protein DCS32_06015 [Dokdonia sp. Dokd-P16]